MWYSLRLAQKHLGKGNSYDLQASPSEAKNFQSGFMEAGQPTMVNFKGQGSTLTLHGTPGPDGRTWFVGPNNQTMSPEQLEGWMESQGYSPDTPVLACGLGAPITLPSGKTINPMFDYQGTYEASMPEDVSDGGDATISIKAV